MGFDLDELTELLVLCGRASHAQSRSGLDEIVTVEQSCRDRSLRLYHLVERVIVNKSTWAQPSSGTNTFRWRRTPAATERWSTLLRDLTAVDPPKSGRALNDSVVNRRSERGRRCGFAP